MAAIGKLAQIVSVGILRLRLHHKPTLNSIEALRSGRRVAGLAADRVRCARVEVCRLLFPIELFVHYYGVGGLTVGGGAFLVFRRINVLLRRLGRFCEQRVHLATTAGDQHTLRSLARQRVDGTVFIGRLNFLGCLLWISITRSNRCNLLQTILLIILFQFYIILDKISFATAR